ncbi:MAG: hypothetical protein BJ554DRAFT_423, partial [Olpidium bornovanus]
RESPKSRLAGLVAAASGPGAGKTVGLAAAAAAAAAAFPARGGPRGARRRRKRFASAFARPNGVADASGQPEGADRLGGPRWRGRRGKPAAAHDWYSGIHICGRGFKDRYGRTLLLRGVNLGGNSKLPTRPNNLSSHIADRFFHHRDVSFVGRPFPLDEIDEHLGRLRTWGLTFASGRLVRCVLSLPHADASPRNIAVVGKSGIYDEEYIDFLIEILKKMSEFGLRCFIDPHQDLWSRFSGGSGEHLKLVSVHGYIGLPSMMQFDLLKNLALGDSPSALQSFALGDAIPQEVEVRVKSWPFPSRKARMRTMNSERHFAWLPNPTYTDSQTSRCVWRAHGVWDLDAQGRPVVLKPDYFYRDPATGEPYVFEQDFYLPFVNRFARAVRGVMKDAFIFVEPLPNEVQPFLGRLHVVEMNISG